MTVGESFLESPARPTSVLSSPAPLGLELFDPSSPSSPSRSPRTPSIESAHHHHDEVNFGNYRHALKISEDARTADRRAWLKGARTFREELITRETMKQADTDKKIAIIIKNRRKAGTGAQQPLPVKRESGAEESMGPPPPPPPLPVHISNGDEVRCCGFLWIASVASRL